MAHRKNKAADPTKAIACVRVSTDRQDLSPDAQRDATDRWATARGVEIVAVYEDIGISGGAGLDKRPGLLAAIDGLREQGAGVLLVARRDRLAVLRATTSCTFPTSSRHSAGSGPPGVGGARCAGDRRHRSSPPRAPQRVRRGAKQPTRAKAPPARDSTLAATAPCVGGPPACPLQTGRLRQAVAGGMRGSSVSTSSRRGGRLPCDAHSQVSLPRALACGPAEEVTVRGRMLPLPKRVEIGDITVRDGLQPLEHYFPAEMKVRLAEDLILAGFKDLEVTQLRPPQVPAPVQGRRGGPRRGFSTASGSGSKLKQHGGDVTRSTSDHQRARRRPGARLQGRSTATGPTTCCRWSRPTRRTTG